MHTLELLQTADNQILNNPTRRLKRAADIAISASLLLLLAPLFPILAIAIKITSPGPIFFKQRRTGLCMPSSTLFFSMIKFRSMRVDAEQKSGAVWATKNDPRTTRFGLFLRKTRLDELPQLWNVLVGDMSMVGPRPERPEFYQKLEDQIPYFVERTYGVLPGITGLAQVNQGYDTCIEDVRSKLGYDLSYCLALESVWSWLKMDCKIMWQTFTVMICGRGQ